MQHGKFRKILACLLALVITFGVLPMNVTAQGTPREGTAFTRHLTGYRAVPAKGRRSIGGSAYNLKKLDPLPTSYNSNDLGYVTSVKFQEYGDCWAHAAMASVETYMIKYGIPVAVAGTIGAPATTDLNLSETAHAYFTYSKPYDELGLLAGDNTVLSSSDGPYGMGGNGYLSMFSLMRWTGPANEETAALAYRTGLEPTDTYDSKYAYAYDASHVVDVLILENTNQDAVKRAIMEYGAGDFSYYAGQDDSDDEKYYNEETGAWYCPQKVTYNSYTGAYEYANSANHAVTLVGWDDNYAISNFNSKNRPSKPGAWIIKNSWGTGWGKDGYYYISYEDTASLYELTYFYKAEALDAHDHNYQYDGTVNFFTSGDLPLTSGSSIASVYTASGNEELDAVAVCVWDDEVQYTLQVYTGVNTTDPTSGTLAAEKSGTIDYCGYRKIDLDAPVSLAEGERYSIVLTLTHEDGVYLAVDAVGTNSESSWEIKFTHVKHENSSYEKTAGGSWENKSSEYNYRIKAYTKDVKEDPVPVTMTYHVGTGTAPAAATGTAGETKITLPTLTEAPDGWAFAGWSKTAVTETTEKPALYAGGASFTLTAKVTELYAVYSCTETGSGGNESGFSKATSLAVGDTVILVSERAGKELIGIVGGSTKYGEGAAITADHTDAMLLTVVAGSTNGTFAFQSDDSYLYYPSGYNSLSISSRLTANTSWTVDFDNDGNAIILSAADSARRILWNAQNNGLRFACYAKKEVGADYYHVQLYRKGAETVTTYNSNPIICDHVGYETTTTTVDATCTLAGYTATLCSNCGREVSRTDIPVLGHLPATEYSKDANGHWHECTRCHLSSGDNESHDFGEWTTVTPATAGEDGEKKCECVVCQYEKTEVLPALGYDYTVSFSVPEGVAAVADMISNTKTGITLPTAGNLSLDGAEYTFAGWVLSAVARDSAKPDEILTGAYTASSDVTLIALYSYSNEEPGSTNAPAGFRLSSDAPEDGDQIIIARDTTDGYYGMTTSLTTQTIPGSDGLSLDGYGNVSSPEGFIFEVTAVNDGLYLKVTGSDNLFLHLNAGGLKIANGTTNGNIEFLPVAGQTTFNVARSDRQKWIIANGADGFSCGAKDDAIELYIFTYTDGGTSTAATYYTTVFETVVGGDVDGDNEVNDKDGMLLERYLAGWSVEVNVAALDIDGNGVVNDWDAVVLNRFLAGWEVTISNVPYHP